MSKTPIAKRERAIAELRKGKTIRATAKLTGLAKDTVQRISAEVFGAKPPGPARKPAAPAPVPVAESRPAPARYAVRSDGTIECYSVEDALALSRALKRRARAGAGGE